MRQLKLRHTLNRNNKLNMLCIKSITTALLLVNTVLLSSVHALEVTSVVNSNDKPAQELDNAYAELSSGSAVYSIPIEVPPAVNGLKPKLSLHYNSNRGNDWIGMGWELVGLGSIERSTNKGVPNYDSGDTFVLNLSGATQSLIVDQTGKYHTQIENYLRIQRDTTNDYWTVTDTGGAQYRFGYNSGNSRVTAIRTGGGTRAWMLDQIKDTHGNYIEINYTQDTTNGDVYPSQIVYSKGNGIACNTPPNSCNTVIFTTEARPARDVLSSYRTGSLVAMDRRLTQISVAVNNTLYRRYTLAYEPGKTPSLLQSVTESGTDNVALPPTVFTYESNALSIPYNYAGILHTYSNSSKYTFMDADLDGKTDILYACPGCDWLLVHNNYTALDPALQTNVPDRDSYDDSVRGRQVVFGDVDNNGLVDAIYDWDKVLLNKGTEKFGGPIDLNLARPDEWISQRMFADINGDGLNDYVVVLEGGTSHHVYYFPSLGTYDANGSPNFGGRIYLATSVFYESTVGEYYSWALGDLNGDGLVDLIHYVYTPGYKQTTFWNFDFDYYLNTGGEFGPEMRGSTLGLPSDIKGSFSFADINHDGTDDLLYVYEHTWYVRLNGRGTFDPAQTIATLRDGAYVGPGMTDLDGDGLIELNVTIGDSEGRWSTHYAKNSKVAGFTNLLKQINTSTGGVISINYVRRPPEKLLAGSEVIVVTVPFSRWVVAQVTTNDGTGLISQSHYKYSGGYHAGWPNNEFRGYRSVTVTDPPDHNGLSHKTQYLFLQDDALKGRIGEIDILNSTDVVLSRTINEYNATEDSVTAGLYRVNQTSTSTTLYDGAATKYNRIDYSNFDNYGHPQTITSSGTGITPRATTTEYLYSDNASTYIVNRSKRTYTTVNGIKTNETWFAYDQQTLPWASVNQNAAPTKGSLTHESHWLSGGTNIVTRNFYDTTYGNLIGALDANSNACGTSSSPGYGYTSFIQYDTTYQTYPTKTINALCQEVTNTYWGLTNPLPGISTITGSSAIPGLLATQTDLNGVKTESYWDGLGRPVATVVPPDTSATPTTRTSYTNYSGPFDFMKASSVVVNNRDDSAAGAPTLDSYAYFDGLGRKVQTKKEDTATGQFITVDTRYDERGLVKKTSVPYTSNTSGYTVAIAPAYTSTLYDELKRPIKITNTDGTSSSIAYAGAEVTTTNEKGVSIKRTYDALNRLTKVEEPMPEGGTTIYTYDTYDAAGNNSQTVRDTANNVTTTRYDTLGHMTSVSDPDRGNWSYEYYPGGQLKRQIDPKLYYTDFTYDSLNRIKTKTITDINTGPDTAPPVGTVDVAQEFTDTTTVTLNLNCLDMGSGCLTMQIVTDGVPDTELWIPYTSTMTVTIPGGDGSKTVIVRFKDAAGNISTQVLDTVTLDARVPTISAVNVVNISAGRADITWTTSQVADSEVFYGTDGYTFSSAMLDINPKVTSHTVNISGLLAATTYHFRVQSRSEAGVLATSGDYTFTTATPMAPLLASAVANGYFNSCALMLDGMVKCWGYNGMGQLGNPNSVWASTPVLVDSNFTMVENRTVSISAGGFQVCAVLSNGTVACWGSNNSSVAQTPIVVSGISTATSVSTAGSHTCALLLDRTVSCWGFNASGQLGNGTTNNSLTPQSINGLSDVIAISAGAGGSHTCALLSNSRIKCWGNNGNGQLGLGYTSPYSATPIEIGAITNATAISAGSGHTCALLVDKTMKCWGRNAYGQLGNNSNSDSSSPVPVLDISNIIAISAGGNYSCAVLQSGAAYCWGLNTDKQLGDGTPNNALRPVSVVNISNVKSITAGESTTCAVLADSSVKCWGLNQYGQLGNGTRTNSATPVIVMMDDNTPPSISGLSSGNYAASAATVTWSTNEAAGSLVLYGTTGNYEASSVPVTSLSTTHTADLAGLAPSTQYQYQAMSWDASGNLALSPDMTFTTAALADVEPPSGTVEIFNGATATSNTSVGLAMTCTDNVVCTQMQIASDGIADTETWLSYSATATTTLTSGDGAKSIAVKFRDAAGNISNQVVVSIILDITSPTGNVTINNGGDSTNNRAVTLNVTCIDPDAGCVWMMIAVDGNADTEGWGNYAASYNASFSAGDGVKTVAVKFRDAAGNTTPTQMTATIVLDTIPPVISSITSGYITGSNATIFWTTNKAADSQVEYGIDPSSYGWASPLDSALVTAHSITLTDLIPSLTYYYRVKSRDQAGNLTTSAEYSFTTTAAALSPCASLAFTASLTPQQTLISLQHFNDLRTDVNTARARAGWPPFNWNSPAPTLYQSVLGQHLVDLRNNLNVAMNQLGLTTSFTDAQITLEGVPIKAQHLNEIRQQVQAVCNY